ncbi:MAG: sugar ABC transporter permease [Ruminococcaceae bacterium]|nr:sugar ABC transporter permease [Oscillospiraceae bacterium]MBD5116679.1 sugar ABC transporter permease [Oscillospiraceae bacterium]
MKNRKTKKHLSWNAKCMLCLIPSLLGTAVFFAFPYLRVLYYSLIDNQFRRNFVWLDNYIETLQNKYFLLALKNSLLLIIIAVPVLIILALLVSLVLSYGIRWVRKTRFAFVLPMVIPTASIVVIWRSVFNIGNFAEYSPLPIYFLFIWKNIGICIVLLTAALTSIEGNIYNAAKLDGANSFTLHTKITIPMIMPTVFFTVLLSIVNSFKIFKESYLFYGTNYPPDHSYTLQYYMNNNFLKLDYQSLASSAVLTSILVFGIVMAGMAIQRRYGK